MSVIRIFDKDGVPLRNGEIDTLVNRSWVLNGIGAATITLAKTDSSCLEEVLRFGNRVLIAEDDMGLWGGIVLPSRDWRSDAITFNVYTIEELLKYRYPAADSYTDYGGNIFEDLIDTANTSEDTLIDVSVVYAGGESYTQDTKSTVYAGIKAIADKTGQDWAIEPAINTAGNLYWQARWFESRGTDFSNDVILEEGTHIHDGGAVLLSEQGPIYNQIKLEAFDGSANSTATTDIDTTSQDKYGLLQGKLTENIPSSYTAQTYADYLLTVYSEPRHTWKLSIINDDNDTLTYLRPGNTVGIRCSRYGFASDGVNLGTEANVRILSMQSDERDSTLTLVVKEV